MPRASSSSLTFICICKLASRPFLSVSLSRSHPYSSAPPSSAPQTGVLLLQRISLPSSLCASSPLLSSSSQGQSNGVETEAEPFLPSPSFLPSCCPSIQSLPALTSSASLPIAFRQIYKYANERRRGPSERTTQTFCTAADSPMHRPLSSLSPPNACYLRERKAQHNPHALLCMSHVLGGRSSYKRMESFKTC